MVIICISLICWSWNSNTLATSCKELTHLKRPWCWERLKTGGEGEDRGWDSWMASPTQWTWVWVNSWSWRWTGKPGMLQSMKSQRVWHNWATELNWTERMEICPEVKKVQAVLLKFSLSYLFMCPLCGPKGFVPEQIFPPLGRKQKCPSGCRGGGNTYKVTWRDG